MFGIEAQTINTWLAAFSAGACLMAVMAFCGLLVAFGLQKRQNFSAPALTLPTPKPEIHTPIPRSSDLTGSRWLAVARGAGIPVLLKLDPNGMTLGRSSQNQLVLIDGQVSRFHARIMKKGDSWVIADLHSSNGTFVNDHQVTVQDLTLGDRIRLGKNIELVFQA